MFALSPTDGLSNIKNQNRGSQKYEQWIIEVQKRCKVLQMADMEKERKTCRALFTYTEHLRVSDTCTGVVSNPTMRLCMLTIVSRTIWFSVCCNIWSPNLIFKLETAQETADAGI